MKITYASAAERAQQNPETFAPTTGDDLADLKPGDFVKICIIGVDDERHGERMWVEVTQIEGGTIRGTLANHPHFVPLSHGATLEFGKGNVFAVQPAAAGA